MTGLPVIGKDKTIRQAMQCIDRRGLGIVFITEADKFIGVVSDGDIRRAILKGIDIDNRVDKIINKKAIAIYADWTREKIDDYFRRQNIMSRFAKESILKAPLLDSKGHIRDIAFIRKNNASMIEIDRQKSQGERKGQSSIQRVLVIGGAGYLGSVLVRGLLDKGYKVRVLDNLMYTDDGIKGLFSNKNFEFIKGDIRNLSHIVKAINGSDAVIHLAAIVGDRNCAADPRMTIEISCLATYNIVEACKFLQVNRFIFASTCSVYGAGVRSGHSLSEDSPLRPLSLYAQSKINCEKKILETMDGNFSPTILRMASLYGYSPGMRFDLVVNLLTARAFFEKKITILGGGQWRPFIHVKDAARAYIRCLESPIENIRGEIFNLSSENHRIIDIGKIIKSVVRGAKVEITDKVPDKRNYKVSTDRISQAMRYAPKMDLIDGLIEIRKIFEEGIIKDYKDSRYRSPKI